MACSTLGMYHTRHPPTATGLNLLITVITNVVVDVGIQACRVVVTRGATADVGTATLAQSNASPHHGGRTPLLVVSNSGSAARGNHLLVTRQRLGLVVRRHCMLVREHKGVGVTAGHVEGVQSDKAFHERRFRQRSERARYVGVERQVRQRDNPA